MEILVIAILLFAFVGAAIGAPKGRAVGGFLLGLVLGPIGWLLIIFGPNAQPKRRGKWR